MTGGGALQPPAPGIRTPAAAGTLTQAPPTPHPGNVGKGLLRIFLKRCTSISILQGPAVRGGRCLLQRGVLLCAPLLHLRQARVQAGRHQWGQHHRSHQRQWCQWVPRHRPRQVGEELAIYTLKYYYVVHQLEELLLTWSMGASVVCARGPQGGQCLPGWILPFICCAHFLLDFEILTPMTWLI